jgi:hypothetical protein
MELANLPLSLPLGLHCSLDIHCLIWFSYFAADVYFEEPDFCLLVNRKFKRENNDLLPKLNANTYCVIQNVDSISLCMLGRHCLKRLAGQRIIRLVSKWVTKPWSNFKSKYAYLFVFEFCISYFCWNGIFLRSCIYLGFKMAFTERIVQQMVKRNIPEFLPDATCMGHTLIDIEKLGEVGDLGDCKPKTEHFFPLFSSKQIPKIIF